MNRRTFARAAAGVSLAASSEAAPAKNAYFELRLIRMRNSSDNQVQRTGEFLGKSALPALERAGAGPVGVFSSVIAPDGPFFLMVTSFPNFSAIEAVMEKLSADHQFRKEGEAFHSLPGLNYVRMEVSLLRAFDGMPRMEVPPTEGRKSPRIFELRVYESNNSTTLFKKIRMFEQGEIAVFRRTGLTPVFFGETIFGRNMPNLTYLLAFDDLAAREKGWRAFSADPEWQKLRAQPGLSDAEIVSNVSNSILRPLPFSQIR